METIDYTQQISNDPPKYLIEHAEKDLFDEEALVYKIDYAINPLTGKKERMAKCTCTACKCTFYEEYVPLGGECCSKSYSGIPYGFLHSQTNEIISNRDDTLCPNCGSEVRAFHSSYISQCGYCLGQQFPMTIQILNEGHVALLEWVAQKSFYKNGQSNISIRPSEGFVFDGKKTIRLSGIACNFYQRYYTGRWKQLKRCTDDFGKTSYEYLINLEKHTLDGTVLENAKLFEYCAGTEECYPITYLRIYQKFNNIENLIMQGGGDLLNSYICAARPYGGIFPNKIKEINFKECQPSKMLELNKVEFKTAIRDEWEKDDIEFYKKFRSCGLRLEDMPSARKHRYYQLESCLNYESNYKKIIHYYEKQCEKDKRNIVGLSYLSDYWNMVNQNGGDLSDMRVKWPSSLVKAHDEEAKRARYKKNEEYLKSFAMFNEKLKKYSFETDEFLIRLAATPEELYQEGKALSHCVASYIPTHAKGKHVIFFVRRKTQPNKPYYTLELDLTTQKVLQNRGKGNKARTTAVEEFEKAWLNYINKLPKEILKNGK